ncbi:MAG: RNA polymerase sigma factor [Phycisphaerales bacterium]|nr:MAG: RNA polymerase sigma factor [Phycisphaerales bacterium]
MIEDRLLIRRFNAGDMDALRRIYVKYKQDLIGVAGALLNDPANIEDVLHDVFVRFASRAGRFQLRGSLKGYLAICAANRARNINRQDGHISPDRLAANGARVPREPDSLDAAARAEQRHIVASALAQLPQDQRQVVVLHVLGSVRFREIARRRGVSINTVQSRYRYGLAKLQSILNSEVDL